MKYHKGLHRFDVIFYVFGYFSQFTHYKEEMFLHAQRAFGITPERHYYLLHAAAEEKPRTTVLTVLVQEADNLEAKDANGKFLLFNIYI